MGAAQPWATPSHSLGCHRNKSSKRNQYISSFPLCGAGGWLALSEGDAMRGNMLQMQTRRAPREGIQCQGAASGPRAQAGTWGSRHQLKPPSRLPLASSRVSPTAANGTRTAEPWSCHFRDLLADLAGKKKEQPKNVTSCTQTQGPSQRWSCECPS